MQVPNQGQWWSNLSIQLSHVGQCEVLGGLYIQPYYFILDKILIFNIAYMFYKISILKDGIYL